MLNLSEQIKSVDLIAVVESAGVQLRKTGKNFVGLCPFHNDRSPSLVVYPENLWWCYSCQIGRDACDFIQRLHGCDFKEACRILGIETGKLTAADHRRIAKAKRNRAERDIQKRYESDLCFTIGTLIRWTRKAMTAINPANSDEFAGMIDRLPYLEYAHETLIFGSSEEKAEVCKAFKEFKLINRNRLFSDDFDYRGWLQKFSNGAQSNVPKRIKVSIKRSKKNSRQMAVSGR